MSLLRCVLMMVSLVGLSQCVLAEQWVDVRQSGAFSCRADFSLDKVRPTLDQLAELSDDLNRQLDLPSPAEPIELYLFHDEPTYRRYLATYFPDVVQRRALFVKHHGPGMVFAFDSPQLDIDLRHECTHALLHAVLSTVPLWLDEGLAEYYEVAPAVRATDSPYLPRVRWRARFGRLATLSELQEKTTMEQPDYRDAWAWTHFLLHGPPEARRALSDLLTDLQSSPAPPPASLADRLHQSPHDPDAHLRRHFQSTVGWLE